MELDKVIGLDECDVDKKSARLVEILIVIKVYLVCEKCLGKYL